MGVGVTVCRFFNHLQQEQDREVMQKSLIIKYCTLMMRAVVLVLRKLIAKLGLHHSLYLALLAAIQFMNY